MPLAQVRRCVCVCVQRYGYGLKRVDAPALLGKKEAREVEEHAGQRLCVAAAAHSDL